MSETRSGSVTLSPELRDRLLYYASRAPSPHNAQGWRIDTDGLNSRVSRDRSRQVLQEFDPQGRESDLACGAVVTNLRVGAAAAARLLALRRRAMNRSLYRPDPVPATVIDGLECG